MFRGLTRRGAHEEMGASIWTTLGGGGSNGGSTKKTTGAPQSHTALGVSPGFHEVPASYGDNIMYVPGEIGGSLKPSGASSGGIGSGSDSSYGAEVPLVEEPSANGYIAWLDTAEGKAAHDAYMKAVGAVNEHGTKFTYDVDKQAELDEIMRQIQAKPEFTFNLEGDALYQQYKDQYMRQGELAMKDTMGQAAALTGGYGNSYAQIAGQQAYYGQLEQLNDKAIDLYQIAYDKHQDERDELYRQYSMLAGEKDDAYNKWVDERDRLIDVRDDAKNTYDEGESEYAEKLLAELDLQSGDTEQTFEYISNMSPEEIIDTLGGYAANKDNRSIEAFLDLLEYLGMSQEAVDHYYEMFVTE